MQSTTNSTFDLTDKELAAARILVETCLSNMGGKRPLDLDADPYTWVSIEDLTSKGYSKHEASGLFGSLSVKGFVSGDPKDSAVTTEGYRWLDTVWDEVNDTANFLSDSWVERADIIEQYDGSNEVWAREIGAEMADQGLTFNLNHAKAWIGRERLLIERNGAGR